MTKSIMFEIKSPYLNSVVIPARLVTLKLTASRLPAGRKNPMIGSIMSFTKAVTNLDARLTNNKCNSQTYYTKSLEEIKELLG